MTILIPILVFLFGLVIGSFLNVCICRIPKEESIIKPASHCVNCGENLKPWDLIPVFSYLFLGGKCRYCGGKVSIRYPLVELLTAVLYVVLYEKYSFSIEFFASVFLMTVLIAVFFIDAEHYIIPDGLVITALIGGAFLFIYNFFNPVEFYGDRNWWNPLVGALGGSAFLLLVAILGSYAFKVEDAMGGGDIKLLAPIGLFLGWKMLIVAFFLSVLIAATFSILLIAARRLDRKSAVPFGPFIVIGTLITLLGGWEIFHWYMVNVLKF